MKKGGGVSDANEKVCKPGHFQHLVYDILNGKLRHLLYSRSIASKYICLQHLTRVTGPQPRSFGKLMEK